MENQRKRILEAILNDRAEVIGRYGMRSEDYEKDSDNEGFIRIRQNCLILTSWVFNETTVVCHRSK